MATIIERIRGLLLSTERQPAKPYKEQGVAGFAAFGGYVTVPEKNASVSGPNRWLTAADLLTNTSIIAASVRYTLNLISRPSWKAEPPSDKPEAKAMAEFVEEAINGIETSWSRIVRRSAIYRYHGFNLQEWVAKKRDDGRIGILSVEPRPVQTITKWDLDEHGVVLGVVQVSPQTGQEIYLPRQKLVYLVDDALTDRPDGMGWFRHLAEPAQRLAQYLRLETMGFERDLSGIPVGRAPVQRINQMVAEGKLTEQQANDMLDSLKEFVSLKSKEPSTGLVLDSEPFRAKTESGETISAMTQWGLDLVSGDPSSIEALGAAVKRLQFDMALIMGTEGMLVGREGEGSRALSEDKSRNLYLTANAALADMAEAYDRDIVTTLWTLNGFPDDLRPTLRTEDVSFKDAESIAKTLASMAAAGAILSPTDPAIDDMRDLMGISRSEPIDPEMLAAMSGGGGDDKGGRPSRENAGDEEDPPDEGPSGGRGRAQKYDPSQPRHPKGSSEGGKWKPIGPASGGRSWVYRVVPEDLEEGEAFKPLERAGDDRREGGVYAFTDPKAAEQHRQLLGGKIVAAQIGSYEPEFVDDMSVELYPPGDAPVAANDGESGLYPKGQQIFIRDLGLIDQETVTRARVRVGKVEKYDPDQPRHPAGSAEGGRWMGLGYRGTPEPETSPEHRHFPGVYMSRDRDDAEQYGDYLTRYYVRGDRRYLDLNDLSEGSRARDLVTHFAETELGETLSDDAAVLEMAAELHLMPQNYPGWPEYLTARYVDGTLFGRDVFVLDPSTMVAQGKPQRVAKYNPDQPRHPKGSPDGGKWSGGSGSARSMLEQMAAMKDQLGSDQLFNFERWLLEHGEEQDDLVKPPREAMGKKKQCYQNAFQAVLHGTVDDKEWAYTEGVVVLEGLPIPIDHAWLSNRAGQVMDVTISDNAGASYFGVPLKNEFVYDATLKQGFYGLFSNGIRYQRITQEPVGDKRAWEKTGKAYNPSQPRDPKGTPTGGQWASVDGEGGNTLKETHGEPPKVGERFVVFRAGREGTAELANRNAGNSLGVGVHLARLDDFERPQMEGQPPGVPKAGFAVHAFEVKLTRPAGKYDYLNAGKGGRDSNVVGFETNGRQVDTFSFGTGGYEARHIGSMSTADILARINRNHPDNTYGDFDSHGGARAGVAISQLFAEMQQEDAGKAYNPDQPRDPRGTPTGGQWTEDGRHTIPSKFRARSFAELKEHPAVESIDDYRPDGLYVDLAPGFYWSEQSSFGTETVKEALRLMESVYWEGEGPPPWEEAAEKGFNPDQPRDPKGTSTGGQWSRGASWHTAGDEYLAEATNRYLADPESFIAAYGYNREQVEQYLNDLKEGFASQTLERDMNLFRGQVLTGDQLEQIQRDGYIDFKKPISFSSDVTSARGYADGSAFLTGDEALDAKINPVVLVHQGKKGEPAIHADPISGDDLNEYILPGRRFHVSRVHDAGSTESGFKLLWVYGSFDKVEKYDPSQPRAPAGTAIGGQWIPAGGGLHPVARAALTDEQLAALRKAIEEGDRDAILAAMQPAYEAAELATAGLEATVVLGEDGEIPAGFFESRTYILPDGTHVDFKGMVEHLVAEGEKFAGPGGVVNGHEALMLIGPPAAGKSTLAEQLAGRGYALVDADEAKKLIPEYQGGLGSSVVHEESSAIAKIVQAEYARRGTNIIVQTVSSGPNSTMRRLDNLAANGYTVSLIGMDVDPNVAAQRMATRYLKTGRFIPADLAKSAPEVSMGTYETLKGAADGYAKVDASGSGSAPIVTESTIEWLTPGEPVQ